MNVFLPYPENLVSSVRVLDDRRLMKQIVETKVLLDIALSGETSGYARHPVAEHYRNHPDFLRYYGYLCCREYSFRFGKNHAYSTNFKACEYDGAHYVPFYAEGSKGDLNYIRTTENVGELFKAKLSHKWNDDKVPPKWTNRTAPWFYTARKNRNYY